MLTANIHSIETAGTLDGIGIRYVIFMQGCPLRCKFCHNPDTWFGKTDKQRTVEELVNDILKYKEFFTFSNGGVTLSGGEPLLQKKFVLELFKELKKNGIHTALDTCGYIDIDDTISEILDYTDLLLFDIKNIDSKDHEELTGKPNDKILKFLEFADTKTNLEIWIKLVLLTGTTAEVDYLEKVAEHIKDFKQISTVELLPYHKMGVHKWEALGYEYKLDIDEPSKETVKKAVDVFKKTRFKVICAE
ncbi:MAG: pyruvate formate-lyase-activating protein [Alphaproteobacteria bacterium]|nr:pyruvate formate-lyase-activating protein [Alphaproteobacteria bacterium]